MRWGRGPRKSHGPLLYLCARAYTSRTWRRGLKGVTDQHLSRHVAFASSVRVKVKKKKNDVRLWWAREERKRRGEGKQEGSQQGQERRKKTLERYKGPERLSRGGSGRYVQAYSHISAGARSSSYSRTLRQWRRQGPAGSWHAVKTPPRWQAGMSPRRLRGRLSAQRCQVDRCAYWAATGTRSSEENTFANIQDKCRSSHEVSLPFALIVNDEWRKYSPLRCLWCSAEEFQNRKSIGQKPVEVSSACWRMLAPVSICFALHTIVIEASMGHVPVHADFKHDCT